MHENHRDISGFRGQEPREHFFFCNFLGLVRENIFVHYNNLVSENIFVHYNNLSEREHFRAQQHFSAQQHFRARQHFGVTFFVFVFVHWHILCPCTETCSENEIFLKMK